SLLLAIMMAAVAVLFWPAQPANAAPSHCNLKQWQDPQQVANCVKQLPKPSSTINECMGIPTPNAPDSGFGGWFASESDSAKGISGLYSTYGYGGYNYPVYNPDCASGASALPSDASTTTTIANGELMVSTGIIGAANAFREKAYEPGSMWGWADRLVQRATKAMYRKVFSIFGVITVAVVGLYLVWRSRQADLSDALTTAGWAVLIMVVVTAVAAWPLRSAHLADDSLVQGLRVVHSAVGPRPQNIPVAQCPNAMKPTPPGVTYDPDLCKDHRSPAIRASDTAAQTVLYNNWLRGTLGSATSTTAKKYGFALYEASTLSWSQAKKIEAHPNQRAVILKQKSDSFQRIAQQIKTEDPDAFNYLQGKEGSARIGAGLISIISALAFGFFDIAASLLIILGFLIFRWAVVAIPVIGTVALLRPASAGFKRLVNIVIAAIFNIIIFGAGASIYLFAVDLIMNTATLPGWLQITLVWLCGVVGWLLLRPYRRITQLGGKSPMGEIANIGSWHKRFFGDLKGVALGAAGAAAFGDIEAQGSDDSKRRRAETTGDNAAPVGRPAPATGAPDRQPAPADQPEQQPTPAGDRPDVYVGSTPYSESDQDADRVWVPATGRYVDGADYDDLAHSVGQADKRISADADAIDREIADYQKSDSAWSRT
ncbi:MAG: hypothetical protein WCA46_14210, partial [Actinocatenispora sp.]